MYVLTDTDTYIPIYNWLTILPTTLRRGWWCWSVGLAADMLNPCLFACWIYINTYIYTYQYIEYMCRNYNSTFSTFSTFGTFSTFSTSLCYARLCLFIGCASIYLSLGTSLQEPYFSSFNNLKKTLSTFPPHHVISLTTYWLWTNPAGRAGNSFDLLNRAGTVTGNMWYKQQTSNCPIFWLRSKSRARDTTKKTSSPSPSRQQRLCGAELMKVCG